MKKTETYPIILRRGYSLLPKPSYVNGTNIDELVKELAQNKVEIDVAKSKRRVVYDKHHSKRVTTEHLDVPSDRKAKVKEYTLRNGEVEIGVRDYSANRQSRRRDPRSGLLGFQTRYESGIECTIQFDDDNKAAVQSVPTIKNVVEDFYRRKNPEIRPIQLIARHSRHGRWDSLSRPYGSR